MSDAHILNDNARIVVLLTDTEFGVSVVSVTVFGPAQNAEGDQVVDLVLQSHGEVGKGDNRGTYFVYVKRPDAPARSTQT